MNEPARSSLEELLLDRIHADLERLDASVDLGDETIAGALSQLLSKPHLSAEERALLARRAADPDAPSMEEVVAVRIERAVEVALELAGAGSLVEEGALRAPRVVVVRGDELDTHELDATLAVPDEDSRELLVVADEGAIDRLRDRAGFEVGEMGGTLTMSGGDDATFTVAGGAEVDVVGVGTGLSDLVETLAAWAAPSTRRTEPLAPAAAESPQVGGLFNGKYRLLRQIGQGGFGQVFEARDETLGHHVAIKVLNAGAAGSEGELQSFKNEARRVTKLKHQNIVDWKVFEETPDGGCFFVMEMLEGEDLEEILKREGRLSWRRASGLLLQVLDALRTAHDLGKGESILHLDLKPRNVFVSPSAGEGAEERAVVIDFGIGQYVGGEEEEELGPAGEGLSEPSDEFQGTIRTLATTDLGLREGDSKTPGSQVRRSSACTPEYASPEQCSHMMPDVELVPLDGRSDLYSLGVMAFQMLTGRLPFEKPKNRREYLRLHREVAPDRTGSAGGGVPRALAAFVDRCLVKDREKRWSDTAEAYRALYRILHPPVWKAVGKVMVPTLALGAGLLWALWPDAQLADVDLFLRAEDGAEVALEGDSLYFGPERPRVELGAVGVEPSLASASLRLVDAKGEEARELSGWDLEWTDSGSIAVTASDSASYSREIAYLQIGGEQYSSNFEVVVLGPEAWSLGDATGVPGLEDRAVDPRGQDLEIWLEGEARSSVEEVVVEAGGTTFATAEAEAGALDGRRRFEIDLGSLPLADGPGSVEVVARDRAGLEKRARVDFEVASQPLSIEGATLNSSVVAGRHWLSPRDEPALSVSTNHRALVRWRVLDEAGRELASDARSGDAELVVALDDLPGLGGGGAFSGSIEVTATDHAYVHRADEGRGTATRTVEFVYNDDLPEFGLRFAGTGGIGVEMEPATPVFTNLESARVTYQRRSNVPVRVAISLASPDGAVVDLEPQVLADAARTEAVFLLSTVDEGAHRLSVRAYRYNSESDETATEPDVESSFVIVADRSAPRLVAEGVEPSLVVRSLRRSARQVAVRVEDAPAGATETPVSLRWELYQGTASSTPVDSGALPELAARSSPVSFPLPEPWSEASAVDDAWDGTWRLVVLGTDAAGNEAERSSLGWTVAAEGPELELQKPDGVGAWFRDAASGAWHVRVKASDRNGVGTVRGRVQVVGDESRRQEIELARAAESTDLSTVWEGRVEFPHTWSGEAVGLRIDAEDVHATRTAPLERRVQLDAIERNRPERVEVAGGASAIERMRLVRGNPDAAYVFAGRSDEDEDALFRSAGLGGYRGDTDLPRSWQVLFEAGDIEDFYLDENEVSAAQFLAFLEDDGGWARAGNWPSGSPPGDERRRALREELGARAAGLPATGVTWEEAAAYARSVGKRLPSLVEWEYALRGGDRYRATATADSTTAVVADGLTPRESGPDRTEDTGLWHLGGNAAEWTSSPVLFPSHPRGPSLREYVREHRLDVLDPTRAAAWADAEEYWVAGGSFASSGSDFTAFDGRLRSFRGDHVGFRCAVSLERVIDPALSEEELRFVAAEDRPDPARGTP